MENITISKTFKIGISGHRDLKLSELPIYKQQIIDILKKVINKYPDRRISIITPLAEGADRLVAECARFLNISYEVLLPMPIELYVKDFNETQKEFYALYDNAKSVEVLPLCKGNTMQNIVEYGPERDKLYLQVGHQVVDRSDFMIFLWDGVFNGLTGGTADIVKYAEAQKKDLQIISCLREVKPSSS